MTRDTARSCASLVQTVALLLAAPPLLHAEGETAATEKERPRVVLALGGGGAKGAAHIGVLRALEELHVPVDAIVGTSMGAIVGGLYASGLSLDEIESALVNLDWQEAFRDRTARNRQSFRRKEDDARLKIKVRIPVRRGKPSLPLGLLQGQKLQLILRRLTLGVSGIDDFDRLPIPFRAVATDLGTGEAVVLGSGDLVLAMRASMSIPAAFDPVELGDRLLVDGGLVSNVPVIEARALGADVVIAVDVGERPLSREELTSPMAVSSQALAIIRWRETLRQLATLGPDDLLFRPDLEGVSTASFLDAGMMIPRGEAAARAQEARLRELSVSASAHAELRGQQSRPPFAAPRVAEIRVVEDAELASRYVTSRLHTRVGEPLDLEQLFYDLERIYGLGVWETVGFKLLPVPGEESGPAAPPATVLEIEAREKTWGTNFVRLGLDLSTDFEGASRFDIGLRYTAMPINRLGGEWRTDVSIGQLMLLRTELYQPLDIGGFFVSPRVGYREDNLPLALGDRSFDEFRVASLSAGVDVGRELGTWGEIRLGLKRQRLEADVLFGQPGDINTDFELAFASARLAVDTFDDTSFPTRGTIAVVELDRGMNVLGGEIEDTFAVVAADTAHTFGRHTLIFGLQAGGPLNDDPTFAGATLGGFLRLSGLRENELLGQALLMGRLVYLRQLGSDSLFGQPIYTGLSLEAGNAWLDEDDASLDDLRPNGSLFFGVDTVLGPMYLSVGFGEHDRRQYSLIFGRLFGRELSVFFN